MAVPFAQTTRSLKADRGIAALVLVGVLSLLLAAWLIWAFTAQFSIYAVGETAPIRLGNIISATFSDEAGKDLKSGQQAVIFLDAPPLTERVVISAQVIRIEKIANGVLAEVAPDLRQMEASPISREILDAFRTPVSGHVEVETEKISPATLLLRSSGINADTATLVSRP